MWNVHISYKKKPVTCFGKFISSGTELSPSLSLYLSLLRPTLEEKKKGGAMSVGSRLTSELVADPDLSGFSEPRSNGPVQFCFMSSHKSLAAYPPTKR